MAAPKAPSSAPPPHTLTALLLLSLCTPRTTDPELFPPGYSGSSRFSSRCKSPPAVPSPTPTLAPWKEPLRRTPDLAVSRQDAAGAGTRQPALRMDGRVHEDCALVRSCRHLHGSGRVHPPPRPAVCLPDENTPAAAPMFATTRLTRPPPAQLRRWIPYVVYYVLGCIVTLALIANCGFIIKVLSAGGLK